MNRYIAIDLELEQPRSNQQTPDSQTDKEKIIQAGIVVFELTDSEPIILHSETYMLNYEKNLSTFIKNLTSIEDKDVNNAEYNAIGIIAEIRELRELWNTSRQIIEWGSGDTKCLMEEAYLTPEDLSDIWGFARSQINVKTLFQCYALANNIKTRGGLSKSMGKLGLQFKGTRYNGKNRGVHWAEADALNTARIFNKIINLMKRT